MATLQELEIAFVNAHKAGDTDAARKLAAVVQRQRSQQAPVAPVDEATATMDVIGGGVEPVVPQPIGAEPSLAESAMGALETGAMAATGATSGLLGYIEGAVEGIVNELRAGSFGTQEAARRIEELSMERARQLTYEPRTETGREYAQTIAEVAAPLMALPPTAEFQAVAGTASRIPLRNIAEEVAMPVKSAVQDIVPAAREAGKTVQDLSAEISQRVRERMPQEPVATPPTSAVGAALTEPTTLRRSQAEQLGFAGESALTEGQASRTFEAQRFERETAKLPAEGELIRERFENQNAQLQQTMDDFIENTGATLTEARDIGIFVDKALTNRMSADKKRIDQAYKKAREAGELKEDVNLNSLSDYLNTNRAERAENGIMGKVQRQIDVLEVGEGSFEDGSLRLQNMTLNDAEAIRRFINKNVNKADPNDVRIATNLKSAIDESTAGAGGQLYRKARALRTQFGKDYNDVGLIKNLLSTKRGSDDRVIALEDVVNKSIVAPSTSLDSIRQLRRVLQTRSGEEGQQAWRELQGATLRYIQNEMLKGVSTNQRGDRVVSPAQLNRAITNLDKSGKLDFIFTKKGAEQLRTINEVAQVILTSPPGTINTSNTATVLAGLMDVALTGTTGIPAPIATSFRMLTSRIKDAKLKARINKTLGVESNVSQ